MEVDGTRSAYSKTFIGSGKRGNKLITNDNENLNTEKTKNGGDSEKYKELLLKSIELSSPQGVAYDRLKKIIYIADTGNDRILKINRVTSAVTEIKLDFSRI